jgi:hypothetical protein
VEIRRLDQETVVLTRLDLFCCELLHQIPVSAQCDEGDAAGQRLYSSPTHGADPAADEDWKEYVAPELRDLFRSAMDVVREDLTDFPPDKPRPYYVLKIPVDHLRGWINALNQARLAPLPDPFLRLSPGMLPPRNRRPLIS